MIDLKEIREEFPVTKDYIYLNNASFSPYPRSVAKLVDEYKNDHLKHGGVKYRKWGNKLSETKQLIANLINATTDEIAFAKNTSEGLTIVAQGLEWNSGDNIIVPNIEFPANIYPWLNLESEGVEVRFVDSKDGIIKIEDIVNLIDNNTKLIAVSMVQFSNGYHLDLVKLGEICAREDIYFVVDGIQGVGNLLLDVKEARIDFLACGGHKWLLGLQGSGFLYCRQEVLDKLNPFNISWRSVKNKSDFLNYNLDLLPNARRFECGTENKLGMVALGEGIALLQKVGIEKITEHIFVLLDKLIAYLEENNYQILSSLSSKNRSAILTFKHLNEPVNKIKRQLLKENVIVIARDGALRVSPHFYNTEEEIEQLIELMPH